MFIKRKKYILISIVLAIFIFLPLFGVSAGKESKLIHQCALQNNDIPTIECFLATLIKISKYILGITGAIALLFFVYGGFLFLTSTGKESQITKGKEVLSRSLIGVIIIFGSYLGITFLTDTILQTKGTSRQIKGDLTVPTDGVENTKSEISTDSCRCYCTTAITGKLEIKGPVDKKSEAECRSYCKDQKYEFQVCKK